MRKLQDSFKTITGRLLCFLQLRDYSLSTGSTRQEMLLTEGIEALPLSAACPKAGFGFRPSGKCIVRAARTMQQIRR